MTTLPTPVIVHVPEGDIVFLSDCMYPNLHHGPTHYTTQKAFPLIDELLSYDANHYIWGHHDEPMPKAEMQAEMAALKIIGEIVDEVGDDKNAILKKLETKLGQSPQRRPHRKRGRIHRRTETLNTQGASN